jgi:hypothetical protein
MTFKLSYFQNQYLTSDKIKLTYFSNFLLPKDFYLK